MKRKLWIILALAALILALGAGAALADQNGTCGTNVNWTYTEANHKLTISGTGPWPTLIPARTLRPGARSKRRSRRWRSAAV